MWVYYMKPMLKNQLRKNEKLSCDDPFLSYCVRDRGRGRGIYGSNLGEGMKRKDRGRRGVKMLMRSRPVIFYHFHVDKIMWLSGARPST